MVISQTAVLCLDASVTTTAARAAATGDRLGRLLLRPGNHRPRPMVTAPSAHLPDADIASALRAALHPER